ncbi:hypothetical protein Malapachy_1786 [Malassezia pachydermatis]|uniref:Uncharacterized protein n=1 Tax=Malassezia pachydermatis TaxID=77020 RepID=A0A0M8MTQ5_9BASI|nr:hypothetical protein Malapachy_1786 [Malassezia pachydermatis]KOS13610.1 hypothetical protein Malapachy_1786 [Malassezia pachydermatis]
MVTAPLYPITTVVPRPLLHLQRATLFRLFSAYVEAKRYVDAARLLRDPRWRPSQPKHMLHVLLRQLRARRLSALSVDPCQSTRAALRETCASFVVLQPRGGKLSAAVFVQMLQMLVQHRLYAEIRVWTHTVRPMVTDEITSDMLHRLTAIVTHMAWQQRAPYEAATMLLALPPGWRTRAMYYALLRHFSEAKVTAHDAIPTTSSTLAAQSARLWKELCVHAEGKGPTSKAYLARLYGHAKRGHAGLAWQDLRQWQQCMPLSPSDRALAQLLLLRALVQAGRLSLAWRMAHRRMAEAWKRYGTATFNTLLSGVSSPAQAHASIHTAFLLQCLYDGILRATQRSRRRRESTEFRDAVQRSPRLSHIHTTKLDLDAWQELVVRLIQLGDQYAYHPDVTTWQWLVQAATRWDLRMDSHTLWHMASLAVPSSPPVGAQDTKMRHTLYMSLAAGFQQRCDTNSARRAYALAQQSRRRVPRRTST